MEKLKGIIETKIAEFETEKEKAEKSLNYSKYHDVGDLETLGNIVICDGKIELLYELLDEIE